MTQDMYNKKILKCKGVFAFQNLLYIEGFSVAQFMVGVWSESLSSGKSDVCLHFKCVIFIHNIEIDTFSVSSEITVRWIPKNLIENQSTLAQIAVIHHYLNQCWPRSLMSHGITRPQCIKCKYFNCHWYRTSYWWLSARLQYLHC